jgi:hypothetical protein
LPGEKGKRHEVGAAAYHLDDLAEFIKTALAMCYAFIDYANIWELQRD